MATTTTDMATTKRALSAADPASGVVHWKVGLDALIGPIDSTGPRTMEEPA